MTEDVLAKIRGKRNELKLTQDDLAKELGVSRVAYARKENGENDFTYTELVCMSSLFNVSLSFFEK